MASPEPLFVLHYLLFFTTPVVNGVLPPAALKDIQPPSAVVSFYFFIILSGTVGPRLIRFAHAQPRLRLAGVWLETIIL